MYNSNMFYTPTTQPRPLSKGRVILLVLMYLVVAAVLVKALVGA